eukprot:COSAG04_NODE_3901_length_2438_cov_1.249679_2_plen_201_part_00
MRTDLAVVHGATGILWYNAGRDGTPRPGPDGVNHTRLAILDEAPTIWEELSSVAKEIGALAPVLLAEPPAGAETVFGIGCANLTGEPYSCWHTAVDLLCREHAGSVYIVAVNPHHHSLVRPAFCLPAVCCCVPTADEVLPCRQHTVTWDLSGLETVPPDATVTVFAANRTVPMRGYKFHDVMPPLATRVFVVPGHVAEAE